MADFNYKSQDDMKILTAGDNHIFLVSGIIAFLFTLFYLLIILLAGGTLTSVQTILYLLIFGGASFYSNILLKKAYITVIKKDAASRPPYQFSLLAVVISGLVFFGLPDEIPGGMKTEIHIWTFILLASAGIALILSRIYHLLFVILVKMFYRFSIRKIMDKPHFVEMVNHKFNEVKRYQGSFAIVVIGFYIPPKSEKKINEAMILPLLMEILQNNIRTTDAIGVLANGEAAAIISNNNSVEGARNQTERLISSLMNNELLVKKIKPFQTEFKAGISVYDPDFEDAETMILNGVNALNEAKEDVHKKIKCC